MILSYAKNLAKYIDSRGQPTAGMRMEIPKHLQSTYKILDSYGYNLQERHGKRTRRIIKFDYIERSLFLAYKIPDSDIWHHITPAMATKYRERENERILASFSGTLSPPTSSRRGESSLATGGNCAPLAQLSAPASNAVGRQTWRPSGPSGASAWSGSSSWN